MSEQHTGSVRHPIKRRWRWLMLTCVLLAGGGLYYERTHPLVFLPTHAHCIVIGGLELQQYANTHEGRYPYHPQGYPQALLLMDEAILNTLTGPGYDAAPLRQAKHAGRKLTEADCGRVYVQGLTTSSNPEIALLFDKLATPGGDHCHLPTRLWAPLGREVWLNVGLRRFVSESEWPEFSREQVELLVKEGFDRQEAERLYDLPPP